MSSIGIAITPHVIPSAVEGSVIEVRSVQCAPGGRMDPPLPVMIFILSLSKDLGARNITSVAAVLSRYTQHNLGIATLVVAHCLGIATTPHVIPSAVEGSVIEVRGFQCAPGCRMDSPLPVVIFILSLSKDLGARNITSVAAVQRMS